CAKRFAARPCRSSASAIWMRSEEHTSELQSRGHLVCRLLLEKKNRWGAASSTPLGYRTNVRSLPAGIYAIVDGSADFPPLDLVGAFVRGGAAVVQLRLKQVGAGELLRIAREARKLCAGRAALVINDRPDVARLAEADGVHLGQEDRPWRAARAT